MKNEAQRERESAIIFYTDDRALLLSVDLRRSSSQARMLHASSAYRCQSANVRPLDRRSVTKAREFASHENQSARISQFVSLTVRPTNAIGVVKCDGRVRREAFELFANLVVGLAV